MTPLNKKIKNEASIDPEILRNFQHPDAQQIQSINDYQPLPTQQPPQRVNLNTDIIGLFETSNIQPVNANVIGPWQQLKIFNGVWWFYDSFKNRWFPAGNLLSQSISPSSGGTATFDLSLSNEYRIQMPAGNITIALSNGVLSQKFIISITQDSVGSRTVTWFTTIRWAGGTAPTLTTTANKRDTFGFIRTGANTYDGFIVGQDI